MKQFSAQSRFKTPTRHNSPPDSVVRRVLPKRRQYKTVLITGLFLFFLGFLSACKDKYTIKEYYKNGRLKSLYSLNKDKEKHGERKIWYKSGELKGIEQWFNGEKDGAAEFYWKNGQLRKRVQYQRNKFQGDTEWFLADGTRYRKITYKIGKPVREVLYHPNGVVKAKADFAGPYRTGPAKTLYPSGELESKFTYLKNRIDGEYKKFRRNGTLYETGRYNYGERTGDWLLFRENGKELALVYYKADKLDGPFIIYHPDGSLAVKGRFTEGFLDGKLKVLRMKDGFVTEIQYWEKGYPKEGATLTWLPEEFPVKVSPDGKKKPAIYQKENGILVKVTPPPAILQP